MRCKYCNYENKEDTSICECCGAVLNISEREALAADALSDGSSCTSAISDEASHEASGGDSARSGKGRSGVWATVFSALYPSLLGLLFIFVFFSVFTYVEKYSLPGINDADPSDYILSVYDPKSEKTYFIYGGELIDGAVGCDRQGLLKIASYEGSNALYSFIGGEGGMSYSYVAVSADGINEVFIPSSEEGSSSGIASATAAFGCYIAASDDGRIFRISLDGQSVICMDDIGVFESYSFITLDGKLCLRTFSEKSSYLFGIDPSLSNLQVWQIAESGGMIGIPEVADDKSFLLFEANGGLYRFDASTDESLLLSEGASSYAVSPSGESIAFTDKRSGEVSVYRRGEFFDAGSGFDVLSVSDDGEIIYGLSAEGASLYSSGIGKDEKRLAEEAGRVTVSGDAREVLFSVEGGIYLSAEGNFPIKVHLGSHDLKMHTPCEDGFIGGLFSVYTEEGDFFCIMNDDYSFEVLRRSVDHVRPLEDGVIIIIDDSVAYRCEEGSREMLRIGISATGYDLRASGFGCYSTSPASFTRFGGSTRIIGEYNGSSFFDNSIAFLMADVPDDLPDRQTVTEENMFSAYGTTYSLYSASRKGRAKRIMDDVVHFWVSGDCIYVLRYNADYIYGEELLVDVYGGKSLSDIKLIVEGVTLS